MVRTTPELLEQARSAIEGSDLVEVNRFDVSELDDDLRRWDGGRPPGVVVETTHPVFDDLRRGLHLHEQ